MVGPVEVDSEGADVVVVSLGMTTFFCVIDILKMGSFMRAF